MYEQLPELARELEELEGRLPDIYASGDRAAAREAGRRYQWLKPVVAAWQERNDAEVDLSEAREMLSGESDAEMRGYLDNEIDEKQARLAELDAELTRLLVPPDPNEGRDVIVEIRGAEGGDEGNLWAGDLFRMYERYAAQAGLPVEVLARQESDMGGYREISFLVKGDEAWRLFKYEAGPHRVQRVPETESQGRIHTSAATVAVLPEAEEVDVTIDPNDLEIDVFRSSGPGGQSVNTTDSAVRVTHKPTGVVVSCQDEKSQLQNKDKAMRILRARLLAAERERQEAELAEARRDQVGGGGRGEKIRTYNFKENRVTDHRVGVTVHKLDRVLEGDLDEIVAALAEQERSDAIAGGA
ncbi:MAG: peptide chain release factor 1 [Acidimicrobiia bacterium]|nr:peptide chain release factor 1 [Acidimicrobiia bacterium]